MNPQIPSGGDAGMVIAEKADEVIAEIKRGHGRQELVLRHEFTKAVIIRAMTQLLNSSLPKQMTVEDCKHTFEQEDTGPTQLAFTCLKCGHIRYERKPEERYP